MILRKMTANFGVLKDETLELTPGLNVIELPNEGGKTTWCAFLRLMLYGPDARSRRDGGHVPWDGSPMSGEIELTHSGKEITIRRFDTPSGGSMRGFSAVYTETDMAVSGLNEGDLGEALTGMSREVFRRTAFIGSGALEVNQSPELEKKIASLIAAGEEGTSFSESAELLRAAQRRCRYRGRGLLPGLEQEMEALRTRIGQIREASSQLEALQDREEELSDRLEELRRLTPEESTPQRHKVITAQRELLELERQLFNREREAAALSDQLRRGPLRGREPGEETRQNMKADLRLARELESAARTGERAKKLWVVFLILCAGFLAAGVFVRELLIAAGAAAAVSIALLFYSRNTEKRRKRGDKTLTGLLKKYGAEKAEDIPRQYDSYVSQWRESQAIKAAAEELRRQTRRAGSDVDTVKTLSEPAAVEAEKAFAPVEEELSLVREEKARLTGRLEAMGDLLSLQSRLAALEEEHGRIERKYTALTIALEELTHADEEMNSRFAPALSRAAEVIFQRLTGGKYSRLAFDRDLSAAVRTPDTSVPRKDQALSRGARDQLYLALRLALCEMMAGEEPCPIVLDDALASFDDERMGYALDYLRELAEHRQILLFTCHSRERRYLER